MRRLASTLALCCAFAAPAMQTFADPMVTDPMVPNGAGGGGGGTTYTAAANGGLTLTGTALSWPST